MPASRAPERILASVALILALIAPVSISPVRAQDEIVPGPDATTTIDVTIDAPEGSGPYAVSLLTEELMAAMVGSIGSGGFGGSGSAAFAGFGGTELAAGSTTTLPIVTEGSQAAVLQRLNVQGIRSVFTVTLRGQSETMISGRLSAEVRVQASGARCPGPSHCASMADQLTWRLAMRTTMHTR